MAPFSADDLTRHTASLRALARDLLADEALADDAVQQACVTALTRPPAGAVSAAAWLRAVVRSCAFDLWRTEQRRRRRELLAARDDGVEARDPAEQLELQEDIVAAVRALDEPYRTVVWLRYYGHRSPTAIAQQLGEPVKTVKTRLWRALQLLRQKLDGRYGSRGTWAGALVPFARVRDVINVAGLAGGGLLMQGKKLLLAGVILVIAIAGTAVAWPRDAAAVTPPVEVAPVASAVPAARAESPPAAAPPVREEPVASVSPFGSLVVRVLWHDHTPAPGVAIDCDLGGEAQLDSNEVRLVADANGVARAPRLPAGSVKLSSDRGGSAETTVAGGSVRDVDFGCRAASTSRAPCSTVANSRLQPMSFSCRRVAAGAAAVSSRRATAAARSRSGQ
jgi:RNA polymerase sigma-70 factor (ECF subfamily)